MNAPAKSPFSLVKVSSPSGIWASVEPDFAEEWTVFLRCRRPHRPGARKVSPDLEDIQL